MLKQTSASCARHSKPRLALHCRVLPSGEFSGMIPESFSVCSESFILTDLIIFLKQMMIMMVTMITCSRAESYKEDRLCVTVVSTNGFAEWKICKTSNKRSYKHKLPKQYIVCIYLSLYLDVMLSVFDVGRHLLMWHLYVEEICLNSLLFVGEGDKMKIF